MDKTCNQCNEQMEGEVWVSDVLGFGNKELNYCLTLKCPNFGLLQCSVEEIKNLTNN